VLHYRDDQKRGARRQALGDKGVGRKILALIALAGWSGRSQASWPGLSRPSTWFGASSASKQGAQAKSFTSVGPCNGLRR